MAEKFTKQVNIKMSEEVYARFAVLSASRDMSISQFLRISAWLGRDEVELKMNRGYTPEELESLGSDNITTR